jgi:hypothetical protein
MLKAIAKTRIWPLFILAFALRVLPEKIRHQHRVADIGLWVSAYPRHDED